MIFLIVTFTIFIWGYLLFIMMPNSKEDEKLKNSFKKLDKSQDDLMKSVEDLVTTIKKIREEDIMIQKMIKKAKEKENIIKI